MNNKEHKKKLLFAFMDAFDDPDLPDGAWQAVLEDAVEIFNKDNGTSFDSYDAFMEYVDTRSKSS